LKNHLPFTKGQRASMGLVFCMLASPSSTCILEPSYVEIKVFWVLATPDRISQGEPTSYLGFPQVRFTHLHRAQCSPGKTGLCTGTNTCQRGGLAPRAALPAVLPLASYSWYSERVQDPHKSGRRHDRLQMGIKCRKQCKY
jgi:hypothetical protein